jgi:hypothetical protein
MLRLPRRERASTSRVAWSHLILAVLLFLLPGCGAIDRVSGVAEAKRLQAGGLPGTARILALWDTGITVNEDPVIGMRVAVQRPDGTSYQAAIAKSLISRLDVPRFQPGATVQVRIDPADPAKVALDAYAYR